MTTLILNGFRHSYDSVSRAVTSKAQVSISLFFDGSLESFSYTVTEDTSNGWPVVSFSSVPIQSTASDSNDLSSFRPAIASLLWAEDGVDRSSTLLSYYSPDELTAYTFQLGGDTFPLGNVGSFNTLLTRVTDVVTPTGAFAPEADLLQTVGLASGLEISEDDTYSGQDGNISLIGGTGNDRYSDSDGFELINYQFLDQGVEVNALKGYVKKGSAGRDTIDGIDDFVGTDFDDVLAGDSGPDGNYLYGRDGDDVIRGNGGDDFIDGGAGNDKILGGSDDDILNGDDGDDDINGNDGDDYLSGGNGIDVLEGGSGNDEITGGEGDDRLSGNRGSDLMQGDDGHDRMLGGSGGDEMFGGAGDDALRGESGRDMLSGGAGDDNMYGGADSDTFVFLNDGLMGRDMIKDWVAGEDKLDFSAFGLADFAALQAFASNQGDNLKIDLMDTVDGVKQIVIIENYDFASFNVSDVIL